MYIAISIALLVLMAGVSFALGIAVARRSHGRAVDLGRELERDRQGAGRRPEIFYDHETGVHRDDRDFGDIDPTRIR